MRFPSPGEIAAHLRARLPGLAAPTQADSPLPFVARRPTVNPVLPVSDMGAAIGFYRQLGFHVDNYDAGYAWVTNCGWEIVHLAARPEMAPGSSRAAAYVHVDDADAWHVALSVVAPDTAIGGVADQPWGKREFAVTDPDGNVIRFGAPS